MKYKILSIVYAIMLASIAATGQQTNPKNQKEMQDRLKAAQSELDKLTPEQKKMMEQMGIKMPASNPVLNSNNAAINKGMQKEFGIVPEKDETRIKLISTKPITKLTLQGYIQKTNDAVFAKMETVEAAEIKSMYVGLKSQQADVAAVGKIATGIWVLGHLQIAVGIMGNSISEDPADADNLSNYAAMLTMLEAEQLAIPLLNYLNALYPNNSTVLNNLGQAWFNLGDISKAEKYLDTTVRLFPLHAPANYTKSFIEESKGNTSRAVELVKKSMQTSVSPDKQNRLRKLGYKLLYNDVPLPFKTDPDPLGLHNFTHPDFPTDAASEKFLRPQWDAYHKALTEKSASIMKSLHQLNVGPQQKMTEQAQETQKKIEAAQKSGDYTGIASNTVKGYTTSLSRRADMKLKLLKEDKAFQNRASNALKTLETYIKSKEAFAVQYEKDFDELQKQEGNDQLGELTYNASFCKDHISMIDKYYQQVSNQQLEGLYNEYIKQLRLKLNEEIFWKQFVMTAAAFKAEVLRYQAEWLSGLAKAGYLGYNEQGKIRVSAGDCSTNKKGKDWGKLGDFNEMTCRQKQHMNYGPTGDMLFECGKLTATLNIPLPKGAYAKMTVITDMNHAGAYEGFWDGFKSFNVEVGAGFSKEMGSAGPLKAEAGLKAGMGMEITKQGIQDIYVTGEAKVEAGTSSISQLEETKNIKAGSSGYGVSDQAMEMGAGGRMSLVTGKGDASGSGVLSQAKINF